MDDDRIFPILPVQESTKHLLKDWLDSAGITTSITFCFINSKILSQKFCHDEEFTYLCRQV